MKPIPLKHQFLSRRYLFGPSLGSLPGMRGSMSIVVRPEQLMRVARDETVRDAWFVTGFFVEKVQSRVDVMTLDAIDPSEDDE